LLAKGERALPVADDDVRQRERMRLREAHAVANRRSERGAGRRRGFLQETVTAEGGGCVHGGQERPDADCVI
jgi:hypothetical protein